MRSWPLPQSPAMTCSANVAVSMVVDVAAVVESLAAWVGSVTGVTPCSVDEEEVSLYVSVIVDASWIG